MYAKLASNNAEHKDWYARAHNSVMGLANELSIEPKRVADVVAITSPRVHVKKNWAMARHYLEHGEALSMTMRNIRISLSHYEKTGQILGPKTSAFAKALMLDPSAIVLDVWMARLFGVGEMEVRYKRVRVPLLRRVRAVAGHLGWTPAETQAALWAASMKQHGHRVAYLEELK